LLLAIRARTLMMAIIIIIITIDGINKLTTRRFRAHTRPHSLSLASRVIGSAVHRLLDFDREGLALF